MFNSVIFIIGDSMQDKLDNMEKFLKYNLEIKNILYNTMPTEKDKYTKEAIIEYSDKLFKALNDIEYYLNNILERFSFSDKDKEYLKNFIKALKQELINCGYDFNKLQNFYNYCFANMNESLVNEVGENCVGYSLFSGVSLTKAKTLNEFLHIIHQTVINDEKALQSLPKIKEKINNEGNEISLYGMDNLDSNMIFEKFPLELSCGPTEIVSLNNNIIMMIRDRGHALSIEIEKENEKYYVKYFIPKICNMDMVNDLKGVRKVTKDSKFTTGIFETDKEHLLFELVNFISKVPMDKDMFIKGGKFYTEEDYQK